MPISLEQSTRTYISIYMKRIAALSLFSYLCSVMAHVNTMKRRNGRSSERVKLIANNDVYTLRNVENEYMYQLLFFFALIVKVCLCEITVSMCSIEETYDFASNVNLP